MIDEIIDEIIEYLMKSHQFYKLMIDRVTVLDLDDQGGKGEIVTIISQYCINECQFITFKGLSTTFEASTNVSFDTGLLTFVIC